MNRPCPAILSGGLCENAECHYQHNIVRCDPCGRLFATEKIYKAHVLGQKHRRKVTNGQHLLGTCSICGILINGAVLTWNQHLAGQKHMHRALLAGADPATAELLPLTDGSTGGRCTTCNIFVSKDRLRQHYSSHSHRTKEQFQRYSAVLQSVEADKNGTIVQGDFDFKVVEPRKGGEGVTLGGSIQASSPTSRCELDGVHLASSLGTRSVSSPFTVSVNGQRVTMDVPLRLRVTFRSTNIGRHEDRVELHFYDLDLRQKYVISRRLSAIVGNQADYDALKPSAPYVPRVKKNRPPIDDRNVLPGVPPAAATAIAYVGRLPQALVPQQIKDILTTKDSTRARQKRFKTLYLPNAIQPRTHAHFFKNLLWAEEVQAEQDLERYDMADVTLDRFNQYYYLTVPGLAEKRPSLLVGDKIYAQPMNSSNKRWYEGHVHFLRQFEVGLRFHSAFDAYSPGARFRVRFSLTRIPLRRQHQSLDAVFFEERLLLPSSKHMPKGSLSPDKPLRFYNKLIATNEPQIDAIRKILAQTPGSAPFVVFGPPGTGKTITIVEAIQQLLLAHPYAKILACAPSNSAADIIATRLCKSLSERELFRFYAPSRSKDQVPDALRRYVAINDQGQLGLPANRRRLEGFRVVVTTCLSASFAANVGLPRGHFSHIFVDEAGQATEPETMVSVKGIADSKTNVVLSGDPKQLGPIVRSLIARGLGLERSYLERVVESDGYGLVGDRGMNVVKLTKNFRSHLSILRFPNDLFYDGDLVPCALSSDVNTYLNSDYLPSKKFPVVFHSVVGKDVREATSPSFFNPEEVLQVKDYVQRLKFDRKYRTSDHDIGVIAPYHAQCQKIRKCLSTVAEDVKVGSVEEFQGQERKVIIISTVRSSEEFVEFDIRHTLGFVASPRRFNVAVTRAKALLIIVGNPQVLGLDPLWRSFLNYIHLNGGWTGPDIPWNSSDPVHEGGGYDKLVREGAAFDMAQFIKRVEALTIAGVEGEEGEDDSDEDEVGDVNVERPWVNNE